MKATDKKSAAQKGFKACAQCPNPGKCAKAGKCAMKGMKTGGMVKGKKC